MQNFQKLAKLIGLWLLIATLAGFVAYQLYSLTMLGSLWLVQSDYRPLYWNTASLKWIARLAAPSFVIIWIFYISLLEGILTNRRRKSNQGSQGKRHLIIMGSAAVICFLLLQLLVLIWQPTT